MTEEFLVECKERKLTSRGEKQFTVTKEMLDKIEKEAGFSRPGVLTFRFKNSDDIFLIADYNVWLGLVQENNQLKKVNSELLKKLDEYNNNKEENK